MKRHWLMADILSESFLTNACILKGLQTGESYLVTKACSDVINPWCKEASSLQLSIIVHSQLLTVKKKAFQHWSCCKCSFWIPTGCCSVADLWPPCGGGSQPRSSLHREMLEVLLHPFIFCRNFKIFRWYLCLDTIAVVNRDTLTFLTRVI